MLRRRRHATHAADQSQAASPAEGPSPVVVIDDDNFLDRTAGGVTIVDFWAPWCGPCRSFAPIFEEAARDFPRVTFGKCDVDVSPKTAGLLQIQSIPTLVVFGADGSELSRVVGVVPRQRLDAMIAQVAPAAAP